MRVSFRKPRGARVVIYDRTSASVISTLFEPQERIEVLDTRLETILVPVIFRMWKTMGLKAFAGPNRQHAYVDAFLNFVKPQVVVTFIDNDPNFYTLAARNHHVFKTAFFQNGRRFKLLDVFESMEPIQNWHVDHMFVFCDSVGYLYKQFIAGEAHSLGSLKNNRVELLESKVGQAREVLWFSGWEPNDSSQNYAHDSRGRGMTQTKYFEMDERLLGFVSKWCRANGLVLRIAGRSGDSDGAEFRYFENHLGSRSEWVFQPRSTPFATYEAVDRAVLSVSLDSTVSYEAMARGARVAIFPWRFHTLESESSLFGWPLEFPPEGPFWRTEISESGAYLLLDKVLGMPESEWGEVSSHYAALVMASDFGNTQARGILAGLLQNPT